MFGLMVAAAVFAAPLHGPESWLNLYGGNVRRDGLKCDLEALKAAGFSGIHFFHIGNRNPKDRPWPDCPEQIPVLSEKWNDLVAFIGSECDRLGLALTLQNCPGWSQSGGPWVPVDKAMREVRFSRTDVRGGEAVTRPEIPAKYRDPESDWRDIAVLAFPTPKDDTDAELKPVTAEGGKDVTTYSFAEPVTVRTLALQPLNRYNRKLTYHQPWLRVRLTALDAVGGEKTVLERTLPVSNWRDSNAGWPISLACDECRARTWKLEYFHTFPVDSYGTPAFFAAARQTDWEAKSGLTLRSLMREPPPQQSADAWVRLDTVLDLSGRVRADGTLDGTLPPGRWTVLRFGHINTKRVNAPAPKEATGWECDKLAPEGIEASFKGYVGKLVNGVLKGKTRGMLVDSWECFGQTWTPRMETYFREANGYEVRRYLPALFGWVLDDPTKTEDFLTDWRRTIGDLITRNYYGRMAELAHEAGIEVLYETAFGDIVYGDLLEYWKYADAPMCEFWRPHVSNDDGGCGTFAYKPIRPCASAAHIYGKRRVVAEAFTGEGITWNECFEELQDVANRQFARGITHLAFQSYTHAPNPNALPPGGCMGGWNGTPFTRLQTWWKHMPEFTAWVTRCEERLESGLPSADVLWYLGDAVDHRPDAYAAFPEGFAYDFLNHDVLTNRLAVKDGRFVIPEGTSWRILWVPDTYRMRPATKAALERLASAGGTVVIGDKAALARSLKSVPKDVATEPALGDTPSEDFMWLHRIVDGQDRYFVAAGTNGYRGKVTFRAKGPVSLFDPVSCARTAWQNGRELVLPPSRSVFVEFGVEGNVQRNEGRGVRDEITGWILTFPSGKQVTMERPASWASLAALAREEQAFGGTAAYEATFDLTSVPGRLELDLGKVASIAVVYVNGKRVNTLWCEPFRVDILQYVVKGRNTVRVEVTNTWRNRVIYDLGQPEEKRQTWIIYQPGYNPTANDPFVPSGLLGPVSLIAEQ